MQSIGLLVIYTIFWFFPFFLSKNNCSWIIQYWQKELHILFCSITPTNLGQFSKSGTDLKSAVPTFSKHPLHVQFDYILAEIFEVKDKWYHSFIFMIIDLIEKKTIEISRFSVKINWLNILDLLMIFDGMSKDFSWWYWYLRCWPAQFFEQS